MKLPDSARELIESNALAHLVTLNEDGSPHVTLVWAGLDGDDIVTAHLVESQQKLQNMRRDSRVALNFESSTRSEMGLTEYLTIYGR
jgi:nitroimidazol reductase NimA-like FMN-containing flavoprotein (pyridoxamine 5'-phosphate oxidase superfamily)